MRFVPGRRPRFSSVEHPSREKSARPFAFISLLLLLLCACNRRPVRAYVRIYDSDRPGVRTEFRNHTNDCDMRKNTSATVVQIAARMRLYRVSPYIGKSTARTYRDAIIVAQYVQMCNQPSTLSRCADRMLRQEGVMCLRSPIVVNSVYVGRYLLCFTRHNPTVAFLSSPRHVSPS
jgi:hypothetical protein